MKRITAVIIILVFLAGLTAAFAAGTPDDPLISLSYITDTFIPDFIRGVKSDLRDALSPVAADAESRLDKATDGYVLANPGFSFTSGYSPYQASAGDSLEITSGTSVIVYAGTAVLNISSGEVIDISTGTPMSSGTIITDSRRIFAAEASSASVTVYSDSALLLADGSCRLVGGSGTAPGVIFTDVPADHWARKYIYALAERRIVSGTGNMHFEPEETMTRGMVVTVLGKISGIETEGYYERTFTDVDPQEYYGPYVKWASDCGLVQGNGDGTFSPEDPITREQMAVIMMHYADFEGIYLEDKNEAAEFADASLIDDWAEASVRRAQVAGLINGKPGGIFDPLGTATRAEVCTLICRLAFPDA